MSDFIRCHFATGKADLFLESLDQIEWPPPEFIYLDADSNLVPINREGIAALHKSNLDCVMQRMSMSEISDTDAEKLTHVARGAEYRYLKWLPKEERLA